MKKITTIIVILILILGAGWGILRFWPQILPRKWFATEVTASPTNPEVAAELYAQWRDSIDALDLLIRAETQPQLITIHKEQQNYYWNKLKDARQALEAPVSATATERSASSQGLAQVLSKVLAVTAAVLVAFIFILLGVLKRKKTLLTRQLNTIQTEARFKEPKGGFLGDDWQAPSAFDPEQLREFSPPQGIKSAGPTEIRSPNHFLEDPTWEDGTDAGTQALKIPGRPTKTTVPKGYSRPSHNHIRPTARQRVTKALKGLAEALSTLKEESPTPTQVRSPHSALNDPKPTKSVLQPSRFDKEIETKEEIVKLARRGFTSSEIARRLRISQDQVETIIRLQRDAGQ